MIAPTQLINVQRGKYEVAIDLSSQQALSLRGNKNVSTLTTPSTWVFWLFANNDPKISSYAANKNFQQGVRYALDYKAIAGVAGPGAIQAPGVIPSMFLGALPQSAAVKPNPTKAKAFFAASGVANQKITIEYPSNFTINGVLFDSLAQKVQANLQSRRPERRARGRAGRHLAPALPRRQHGVRSFAVGPGLSGSRRLPRLHAG